MDARLVLVLGATGYVGGRLVPRLLAAGYRVRCLARTPSKLAAPWVDQVEVVEGDLLDAATLPAAFAGAHAVFHLVHMMGTNPDFEQADRTAAQHVAQAAADAGVARVVYLGGLGEDRDATSPHLRSRAEVGRILLAADVPVTVLRAAVVIGSGSASFEMLRHLVEKLPVMVTPRWVNTRTQPIAIRDVLRYLVGVLDTGDGDDHVYDIGGPDVLTYLDMMRGYARAAGLPPRLIIQVPVLTPVLSSYWVNLVTPVPFGLAKPLVSSLSVEVVVRPGGEDIRAVVPGEPLRYHEALAAALARVRDRAVESSWSDAALAGRSPAEPYPGDPEWTGGTLLTDTRTVTVRASAADVFAVVTAVGGDAGWPAHGWAWRVRGLLDRAIGGVGLRRGRRDPEQLRTGDALDFWRVEELREPAEPPAGDGLVRLRAEMRLPGRAWLEWRITPTDDRVALRQRALFAPRGLLGRLYWWVLVPFHGLVFGATVGELRRRAEARAAGHAEPLPPVRSKE
ncbi:MAG: SDR family oxidoreductase [Egibacteraceae bacterium]